MNLLNDAYQTLSHADKRTNYDANWRVYQTTSAGDTYSTTVSDYLAAGPTIAYSQAFRDFHQNYVQQFKQTPLNKNCLPKNLSTFESDCYNLDKNIHGKKQCHNIFALINVKTQQTTACSQPVPTRPLSIKGATTLFIDYLQGHYFGHSLVALRKYLATHINKLQAMQKNPEGLIYFQTIQTIISMTDGLPDDETLLLLTLQTLTHFARNASEAVLSDLVPLFYNKFFRNLYAYAQHLYWQASPSSFNAARLSGFNGFQEAKALLNQLRDRLSNNSDEKNLAQLVQYIKLLCSLENAFAKATVTPLVTQNIRQSAFELLDWVPAIAQTSSKSMLTNLFLRLGSIFQYCSQTETALILKMADESIALKLYLFAVTIGNRVTPDIEIYVNTHVLSFIMAFQFEDDTLVEIAAALQKRTTMLTDIFPFSDGIKSNITFFNQDNQALRLMRYLLNTLLKMHEYNKTHTKSLTFDHSASTLLYQVYEACLKNWYQENFDAAIEEKFRLELLDELLADKGFSFFDVEQHLDFDSFTIDCDTHGWLQAPIRAWSNPNPNDKTLTHPAIEQYRSIDGAEINQKTGEINFYLTQWTQERPNYEQLFTLSDVHELLEKNIDSAYFSLDPADADRPYHPFNLMRFAPEQLMESELLHSMLLTDYMLKFFTTYQEVQGQYPFACRPVDSMIAHLPEYLREIIENFHSSRHSGEIHRFWIEAGEIDVTMMDNQSNADITGIQLGELTMRVKKHRMARDIHGELNDVGDEDEGWPIYVLTDEQVAELKQGKRRIDGHAMIFIYATQELFYWENHQTIKEYKTQNYRETLTRLFRQPIAASGLVKPTQHNNALFYRMITQMAKETGLSHRYSPEFIFAHKFTLHYDEFAQYLPEFGRLKVLSQITVLIRMLNSVRQSNLEQLKALDWVLSGMPKVTLPVPDFYQDYQKNHQEICKNISDYFSDLRKEAIPSALKNKWQSQLTKILTQIGRLDFGKYDDEVEKACNQFHKDLCRSNPKHSSADIWRLGVEPKREEIAKTLSKAKQESYRKELRTIFADLNTALGAQAFNKLLNDFLQKNSTPLVNALVNHEKATIEKSVQQQLPQANRQDIAQALAEQENGAIARIATAHSHRQLNELKVTKQTTEKGFVNIHLGQQQPPSLNDLKDHCFWVPASIRHEVGKDVSSGLERYSFFVYGGVNIQPKINIKQGNGNLTGNRTGGTAINSANAQDALRRKMETLEGAQRKAVKTEKLPDGRVRYYRAENPSRTPGPTRGAAYVTEHNLKTGQVRTWYENYDKQGKVNRIHPKTIDGQNLVGQHYPPTQKEMAAFTSNSKGRK